VGLAFIPASPVWQYADLPVSENTMLKQGRLATSRSPGFSDVQAIAWAFVAGAILAIPLFLLARVRSR